MKQSTRVKTTAREGQAAAARLLDRAPHLLLTEFTQRKVEHDSPATKSLDSVIAALKEAIGTLADDPDVSAALHKLDGVIWEIAVEHEDRAWHAAWTLAMNLRGR